MWSKITRLIEVNIETIKHADENDEEEESEEHLVEEELEDKG